MPPCLAVLLHATLSRCAAACHPVSLCCCSVRRQLKLMRQPLRRYDNGSHTLARIGCDPSTASSSTVGHVVRVQQHAAAHDRSAARPQHQQQQHQQHQQQQQQQQQRRRKAKQRLELVEELNADATAKRRRTDASSAPSSSSSSSGAGAAATSASLSLVHSGGRKKKRDVKTENVSRV
jgi:hypothetical protein